VVTGILNLYPMQLKPMLNTFAHRKNGSKNGCLVSSVEKLPVP
jgi:hypothetical protein